MDLSSCRPQSKAAQYHLDGKPGRHVVRERLPRPPAELDRAQQIVERPRLRLAGEVDGGRTIRQQRGGGAGPPPDAGATPEPESVPEPPRPLAVQPLGW